MKRNPGFTLIELMIVIAIIAVIAAIAIPGLLSSIRAANERSASASLKTLASAEADVRANDRDGNRVTDFWTRNTAGLYGVCPVGTTELIKLIDMSVAGADFNPDLAASATPTAGTETLKTYYTVSSPKAGYWYRALASDEEGNPYAVDTQGAGWAGAAASFNPSRFGFQAFPDSRAAGRQVFIINEENVVFRRGVMSTYRRPSAPAADCTGLVGTSSGIAYPNDASLKSDYSRTD